MENSPTWGGVTLWAFWDGDQLISIQDLGWKEISAKKCVPINTRFGAFIFQEETIEQNLKMLFICRSKPTDCDSGCWLHKGAHEPVQRIGDKWCKASDRWWSITQPSYVSQRWTSAIPNSWEYPMANSYKYSWEWWFMNVSCQVQAQKIHLQNSRCGF